MLAESFLRSGKVRDLHMLDDGRLLLVASDRISAFDVVLPSMIPDKGRVLTGLSRFWFAETAGIVPNHLLDTAPAVYADYIADQLRSNGYPPTDPGPLDALRGRLMICRPAFVVPIEAVVRGYLAGSGWKEYQASGTVCGIPLPRGLRESDRLPEPIFTPATKAAAGEHDENISFDRMIEHIGREVFAPPDFAGRLAEAIRDRALRLYGFASAVAERRGILLADTKFEFGEAKALGSGSKGSYTFRDADPADRLDQLILIDEAITPDSSRFWDAASYEPGRPQASFDKQFVRDWLETRTWDKTAPGPELPQQVIDGTRARYVEAYERLTGASFERYLQEDVIAA
jgi:phosphoribosylaminoimidazole-succinocarboxamide synthase